MVVSATLKILNFDSSFLHSLSIVTRSVTTILLNSCLQKAGQFSTADLLEPWTAVCPHVSSALSCLYLSPMGVYFLIFGDGGGVES